MGIEFITDPTKRNSHSGSAGRFNLPAGFDSKKWAAEWVRANEVPAKMQRQALVGIPATADGWTVYHGENGAATRQFVVEDPKQGKFILMVRPRAVQEAVNSLYGNLGKERTRMEQEGKTAAGEPLQDRGMVTEERLRHLGLAEEPVEVNPQLAPTPIRGLSSTNITAQRTT